MASKSRTKIDIATFDAQKDWPPKYRRDRAWVAWNNKIHQILPDDVAVEFIEKHVDCEEEWATMVFLLRRFLQNPFFVTEEKLADWQRRAPNFLVRSSTQEIIFARQLITDSERALEEAERTIATSDFDLSAVPFVAMTRIRYIPSPEWQAKLVRAVQARPDYAKVKCLLLASPLWQSELVAAITELGKKYAPVACEDYLKNVRRKKYEEEQFFC